VEAVLGLLGKAITVDWIMEAEEELDKPASPVGMEFGMEYLINLISFQPGMAATACSPI
jgi:hypothetical protein